MCAIPCSLFILGRNPVLRLDDNVVEDAMKNITDPVAAFLSSDEFTSVVPEGVEVIYFLDFSDHVFMLHTI